MLVFIILLVIAILLLVLSFFKKDRVAKVEEELEQLALAHMQDVYQLKKKIKILEEELLLQDIPAMLPVGESESSKGVQINAILKNQVLSLHQQGLAVNQIARQSTLPPETVMEIIEMDRLRGNSYE
jgi:hypothetical protein